MSADNEIAILRSEDGIRVAHIQASDNLTYRPDYFGFNRQTLIAYFRGAPVFTDMDDAFNYAENEANKCYVLEYGITFYDLNATFPT